MGSCLLRPEAVNDLSLIWDYTCETWGEEQAERYIRLINRSFTALAKDPSLGRACDIIREGYRKHLVGRYVVFCRVTGEGVDVVRVLHQRMDFDRHL